MDENESKKSIIALKANLWVDFFFMAGTYPAIFLLCMHLALRMESLGCFIFLILAWLQAIAWLFDVLENIYLFNKIKNPTISKKWVHKTYKLIVKAKWIIATIGAISSIFGLVHYWINGHYTTRFLNIGLYILVIITLLILYIILRNIFYKTKKYTVE